MVGYIETVTRQGVRDTLTCTKHGGNMRGGGRKADPNDTTRKVWVETEFQLDLRVQGLPPCPKAVSL